jgi:tetratricopeptide (TPR) repeat protein
MMVAAFAVGPLVASGGSGLMAQTPSARFVDSARAEIERGLHDMDMKRLDQAQTLLDRALIAFPDDPYLLHYRGYLAYRQATAMLMMGDKGGLGPVITRGLADLSKSAEKLQWPETLALEACLTSMRIPLEPGSGMTLGPMTGRFSADAAKLGPDNPRVALLQAYLAQQTPETMGGGVERARALVSKALALFQNDHPAQLAPAWGKDEAVMLQQRLTKSGGG